MIPPSDDRGSCQIASVTLWIDSLTVAFSGVTGQTIAIGRLTPLKPPKPTPPNCASPAAKHIEI